MSEMIIPIILGKGQGVPPLFGFLWLVSELSQHWWVSHLDANVLQWAYNEVHSQLEVKSATILELPGSNQFMSCP